MCVLDMRLSPGIACFLLIVSSMSCQMKFLVWKNFGSNLRWFSAGNAEVGIWKLFSFLDRQRSSVQYCPCARRRPNILIYAMRPRSVSMTCKYLSRLFIRFLDLLKWEYFPHVAVSHKCFNKYPKIEEHILPDFKISRFLFAGVIWGSIALELVKHSPREKTFFCLTILLWNIITFYWVRFNTFNWISFKWRYEAIDFVPFTR